jgi:hypothetical protein
VIGHAPPAAPPGGPTPGIVPSQAAPLGAGASTWASLTSAARRAATAWSSSGVAAMLSSGISGITALLIQSPGPGGWLADEALASSRRAAPPPRPLAPPPSPVPLGGLSSGAGALSASGLSILLLLAGLLGLGAQQARRRMQLASRLLCPAPFALLPERPG